MSNYPDINLSFQFPFNLNQIEIEQVYNIDIQNINHPWNLKNWGNCVSEADKNWFILYLNQSYSGKIFGYIVGRIFLDICTVEIDKVVVDKSSRGKGYANLLFSNLYKELINLGDLFEDNIINIVLEVEESNVVAVNFYEKQGLRPIGRRIGFYSCGSTAITYRKYLKLFG